MASKYTSQASPEEIQKAQELAEQERLTRESVAKATAEQRAEERRQKNLAAIEEEKRRQARRDERERFLTPDLSLDDMYRQACTRVYFMKSKKDILLGPGEIKYDNARKADNWLSKLKYNDKKLRLHQKQAMLSLSIGKEQLAKEEYEKYDEYVSKFLYCSYGIGVLFGEFMQAIEDYND